MRYKSAEAFRQSLEQRISELASRLPGSRQSHIVRHRKMVVFERFLARVQSGPTAGWLVKGGYALQLRMRERARTTKDLDLAAENAGPPSEAHTEARILKSLAEAAQTDCGDFFRYAVEKSRELRIDDPAVRAYRFRVSAELADRAFESFQVDVGVGDPRPLPPVDLPGSGLLDFAGIPPATFRAVAPEQHFAEKVHAMTRSRGERENTRVRDLVDVALMLDAGCGDPAAICTAVRETFRARGTHEIPRELPDSPALWRPEFRDMAVEIGLSDTSMDAAMACLRTFWRDLPWHDA